MPNNQPAAAAAGNGEAVQRGFLNRAERACSNKSFSRHGAGSQREEVAAAWQPGSPSWSSRLWPIHGDLISSAKVPQVARNYQGKGDWSATTIVGGTNSPSNRDQIAQTTNEHTRLAAEPSTVRDRSQVTKRGKLCSSYEAVRSQLLSEVKAKTAGQAVQSRRGKRRSGSWCRDYNLDTGKQ